MFYGRPNVARGAYENVCHGHKEGTGTNFVGPERSSFYGFEKLLCYNCCALLKRPRALVRAERKRIGKSNPVTFFVFVISIILSKNIKRTVRDNGMELHTFNFVFSPQKTVNGSNSGSQNGGNVSYRLDLFVPNRYLFIYFCLRHNCGPIRARPEDGEGPIPIGIPRVRGCV